MDIWRFVTTFSLILLIRFALFLSRKTYACSTYLVGTVADDKLTASSVFQDDSRVAARQARLNLQFGWSPDPFENNPWIQVSFGRRVRIKEVLTQGLGDVTYQEWVTKYKVLYRDTSSTWTTVQYGSNNEHEFPANYDYSTTVKRTLPSTISATFLRLYPTQCHNFCSLRFDIIGCDEVTTTTMHTTTTVLTTQTLGEITSPSTVTSMTTTTMHTTTRVLTTQTLEETTSPSTITSISITKGVKTTEPDISSTTTAAEDQTTHAVSSGQSNKAGSLCLCTCTEDDNSTLTEPELEVRISNIIQILAVPKNTTSNFIRRKISTYDSRPEVVYVGSFGIAFICVIVISIIVPDILLFSRYLYITTQNKKEL